MLLLDCCTKCSSHKAENSTNGYAGYSGDEGNSMFPITYGKRWHRFGNPRRHGTVIINASVQNQRTKRGSDKNNNTDISGMRTGPVGKRKCLRRRSTRGMIFGNVVKLVLLFTALRRFPANLGEISQHKFFSLTLAAFRERFQTAVRAWT